MRTPSAIVFSTLDGLPAQFDVRRCVDRQHASPLQMSGRENEKTSELVLVEITDRVDEIPIEGHDR